MKRPYTLRMVAMLWLALTVRAGAQFYAPDTEYHDKAQRLFVVEAARTLAWRGDPQGQKVWEVTYQVKTDTNHLTTWEVKWLDKAGKALNQFQVQYPEAWLTNGPQFYRDVFQQVLAGSKQATPPTLTAEELKARFWQGAERTGLAREDGLRAALTLTQTNLDAAHDAPTLAGLLTHIPLPSLSGGVTLDAMLLARGAAWLALSESQLKDPKAAADENWAPVLFMAGRENAACALWKAKVPAGQDLSQRPVLFEWWDFFLRRPKARAAYEFAAGPRQQRFGMPLITYYSRVQLLGTPTAEVLVPLYGPTAQSLQRLYNYGGFLSASTSIGGGRLLEGAWAALFREQWLKTLKAFHPAPPDYVGYREKLEGLSLDLRQAMAEADDFSLAGLKECTPLLELGYEQGTGKLTPVSAVTARDLLNYGWEMNALLMGARYYFVANQWGVPELARKLLDQATRDIQGQAPFFRGRYQQNIFNLKESLYRLQLVDDLSWRVQADVTAFAKDITDAAAARTFYQRCWLRPYEVRWQAYTLCRANQGNEVIQLLRRYHQECGRKSDQLTMEYLADWEARELAAQPELQRLAEQLAEEDREPGSTQIKLLYQKRYQALINDQRAEAYEKIFWRNPDCGLEQEIFNGYIVGGAFKSAKRFYTQAREVVSREVGFSNFLAPKAWMLGFLEGDEELMKLALEDSQTGSYVAMMTHIWQAAAHDDTKAMEQQLDELLERYESEQPSDSQGHLMKSFVPLLPALKDPKDPRHEEALDHFGKTEAAANLRWILIQKYKLSVPDAIRFLGGRETDRYRRVLILYLEQQKDPINQAVVDYISNTANTGAGRVVASWARMRLLKASCRIQERDLRPADAKSIEQAVLDKLEKSR